jgi:hypothetical protein
MSASPPGPPTFGTWDGGHQRSLGRGPFLDPSPHPLPQHRIVQHHQVGVEDGRGCLIGGHPHPVAQFDQTRARSLGCGLKPGDLLFGRLGISEGKTGRLRHDQEGRPDGDALRGRDALQPDLAHLRPRPAYM